MKMVKASVDEENVIATIREAPMLQFDLTADAQIALAVGCMMGKINGDAARSVFNSCRLRFME